MSKLIQIAFRDEDMFGLDDQGRIWVRDWSKDRGVYWELLDEGVLVEEEEAKSE